MIKAAAAPEEKQLDFTGRTLDGWTVLRKLGSGGRGSAYVATRPVAGAGAAQRSAVLKIITVAPASAFNQDKSKWSDDSDVFSRWLNFASEAVAIAHVAAAAEQMRAEHPTREDDINLGNVDLFVKYACTVGASCAFDSFVATAPYDASAPGVLALVGVLVYEYDATMVSANDAHVAGNAPVVDFVGLSLSLALAVHALHNIGLVHQDIQWGNVLVSTAPVKGSSLALPRVQLIDFGRACLAPAERSSWRGARGLAFADKLEARSRASVASVLGRGVLKNMVMDAIQVQLCSADEAALPPFQALGAWADNDPKQPWVFDRAAYAPNKERYAAAYADSDEYVFGTLVDTHALGVLLASISSKTHLARVTDPDIDAMTAGVAAMESRLRAAGCPESSLPQYTRLYAYSLPALRMVSAHMYKIVIRMMGSANPRSSRAPAPLFDVVEALMYESNTCGVYRLAEAAVGRGTYGRVHYGTHIVHGTTAVVKMSALKDDGAVRAFVRENVVLDYLRQLKNGSHECADYVACAVDTFVFDGGTLAVLADVVPPPVKDVTPWGATVLEIRDGERAVDLERALTLKRGIDREATARALVTAVAALHSVGVAHRDLKPMNILAVAPPRHVRLIDFGLSCMSEAASKRYFVDFRDNATTFLNNLTRNTHLPQLIEGERAHTVLFTSIPAFFEWPVCGANVTAGSLPYRAIGEWVLSSESSDEERFAKARRMDGFALAVTLADVYNGETVGRARQGVVLSVAAPWLVALLERHQAVNKHSNAAIDAAWYTYLFNVHVPSLPGVSLDVLSAVRALLGANGTDRTRVTSPVVLAGPGAPPPPFVADLAALLPSADPRKRKRADAALVAALAATTSTRDAACVLAVTHNMPHLAHELLRGRVALAPAVNLARARETSTESMAAVSVCVAAGVRDGGAGSRDTLARRGVVAMLRERVKTG